MKNFMQKYAGIMAALALVVTTLMANSTCSYTMHQDEMPEVAKKLRKF
ncbi:MAG: cyclic lactone autoinducer peptide [Oscillospiraceae bacterium]|nr:cyclic lactone autoinducer peptide [Oscillospiraceae bacterium]